MAAQNLFKWTFFGFSQISPVKNALGGFGTVESLLSLCSPAGHCSCPGTLEMWRNPWRLWEHSWCPRDVESGMVWVGRDLRSHSRAQECGQSQVRVSRCSPGAAPVCSAGAGGAWRCFQLPLNPGCCGSCFPVQVKFHFQSPSPCAAFPLFPH